MLSLDTERKLAEVFLSISNYEREVERCRYLLAKNYDFDPASMFRALDFLDMGSISSSEVQEYLKRHHFFCSADESYLVVRQYDNNQDGRLSFEEFIQFALPSTNPSLRELTLTRKGLLTAEVEHLFNNLLQAEVFFHRNVEALKREIVMKTDFNLLEAFRTVNARNLASVDEVSLTVFLRRYTVVNDDDLDAIFRRLDNDGDSLINYSEFVDFIMPSRSNSYKTREISPPSVIQPYRNSSPLRNASNSQYSFRKTSPLRNSPPREARHSSPLRPLNGSSIDRHFNGSSIDRPFNGSSIDRHRVTSPLKQSVNRNSSPLRANKTSPLRSQAFNESMLRSSYIPERGSFAVSEKIISPRHSSPLRNTYTSMETSSFRKTSPLRESNLYQSSPYQNLSKTTDFQISHRNSSPLRKKSPERSYLNESRSGTFELSKSTYVPQKNSVEEQEIVLNFQEEIRILREIETSKNNLALKHDFNLIDAFRIFDKHDLGIITISDIDETLECLGYRADREELYLLVRHYSHLQDSRLRFADFTEMLTPKHEDYSKILRNRVSLNIPGAERSKVFSRDTSNIFCNTLRLILNAETVVERLRQRLSKMPESSLFQAFNSIDKDKNGYITIEEFQKTLQSYGVYPSSKDLQGLMQKYDKNKDGRVSYSEFVEEVTPKSPKKF